jgi:murein DD-endopeptidase MepM/ murein hydrolase activator NlpD
MRRPALALCVLVLTAALPAAAGAAPWRAPVPGAVVRGFDAGATPYAGGAHRGVDLAARPGDRVRAACAGIVRFAGRTPRGPAVTVRCAGGIDATHLGLEALRVRAGRSVTRGAPLGTVAARGEDGGPPHVHLGARRGRRYLDPLALIGAGRATPPPPLAPRAPHRRPPGPVARPAYPAMAPPQPARAPLAAWGGAALLALSVPATLVRRRARRRLSPAARPRTSRPPATR